MMTQKSLFLARILGMLSSLILISEAKPSLKEAILHNRKDAFIGTRQSSSTFDQIFGSAASAVGTQVGNLLLGQLLSHPSTTQYPLSIQSDTNLNNPYGTYVTSSSSGFPIQNLGTYHPASTVLAGTTTPNRPLVYAPAYSGSGLVYPSNMGPSPLVSQGIMNPALSYSGPTYLSSSGMLNLLLSSTPYYYPGSVVGGTYPSSHLGTTSYPASIYVQPEPDYPGLSEDEEIIDYRSLLEKIVKVYFQNRTIPSLKRNNTRSPNLPYSGFETIYGRYPKAKPMSIPTLFSLYATKLKEKNIFEEGQVTGRNDEDKGHKVTKRSVQDPVDKVEEPEPIIGPKHDDDDRPTAADAIGLLAGLAVVGHLLANNNRPIGYPYDYNYNYPYYDYNYPYYSNNPYRPPPFYDPSYTIDYRRKSDETVEIKDDVYKLVYYPYFGKK